MQLLAQYLPEEPRREVVMLCAEDLAVASSLTFLQAYLTVPTIQEGALLKRAARAIAHWLIVDGKSEKEQAN